MPFYGLGDDFIGLQDETRLDFVMGGFSAFFSLLTLLFLIILILEFGGLAIIYNLIGELLGEQWTAVEVRLFREKPTDATARAGMEVAPELLEKSGCDQDRPYLASMGIYLFDAFGNLELIYRDPEITSMNPLPIRSRPKPPVLPQSPQWTGPQEGEMLVMARPVGGPPPPQSPPSRSSTPNPL